MSIKIVCHHCTHGFEVLSKDRGTTAVCPSCGYPVAVPQVESCAADSAGAASQAPSDASAIAWVVGVLIGLGILIGWLGWTTFITIVLWIIIVGAVLVAGGFGLAVLGNPTKQAKDNFASAAVICGIAVFAAWSFMPSTKTPNKASSATTPQAKPAPRVEEVLTASLQQALNQNKQQVFNSIHPMGTARGATVHDVAVTWKNGQPTNRPRDVQAFTVRYTLYWQGPITKDGFTKVSATFDAESQRWIGSKILATNGVTNDDAGEALVKIGAALVLDSLNNQ